MILGAAITLLVVSALLILNTIRLAMFARRREIGVQKLVGATNWFIRVPFMLEGLVQGFVGALLAFGGVWGLNRLFSTRVAKADEVDVSRPRAPRRARCGGLGILLLVIRRGDRHRGLRPGREPLPRRVVSGAVRADGERDRASSPCWGASSNSTVPPWPPELTNDRASPSPVPPNPSVYSWPARTVERPGCRALATIPDGPDRRHGLVPAAEPAGAIGQRRSVLPPGRRGGRSRQVVQHLLQERGSGAATR